MLTTEDNQPVRKKNNIIEEKITLYNFNVLRRRQVKFDRVFRSWKPPAYASPCHAIMSLLQSAGPRANLCSHSMLWALCFIIACAASSPEHSAFWNVFSPSYLNLLRSLQLRLLEGDILSEVVSIRKVLKSILSKVMFVYSNCVQIWTGRKSFPVKKWRKYVYESVVVAIFTCCCGKLEMV